MAKVSGNMLTSGLRGKIGQFLVFRVIQGKTYASRAPGKQDKSKETEAQRQTRTNLREASLWAKSALLDPQKKKYYLQRAKQWKLTNAHIAAVREYMRDREETIARHRDRCNKMVTKTPNHNELKTRQASVPGVVSKQRSYVGLFLEERNKPIKISRMYGLVHPVIDCDKRPWHGLITKGKFSDVFSWPQDMPPDAN
jgi:hypothetical protein